MPLLLPFFLLSLLLFKEDPPRIIHDDDNITSWLFLLVTVEAQAQRHSHTQHKTTIMHRMSNWFFLSSCCPVHASLKIASHLYIIVWRLCTTYTKHNFMHELLCFDAVPFHLVAASDGKCGEYIYLFHHITMVITLCACWNAPAFDINLSSSSK